ncbi:hypothetical protein CPB85DRAFT_1434940 [Mucidula mucida]|nr:hypothetical protein CPB85DRAFT_1434940 [Mucidula mucida]
MSNLRTYSRRSRKLSRKDNGSQSRADSPAHDTDTEPEEVIVASSTARPTRALGPQPTPQRNIQPLQAMPDDARQRAESASLIGARCALTHVAATKGEDIHEKSKVQLMHVLKRASDELTIRTLEYILGMIPGLLCVDSSSNLFYGIRALHEPFDAAVDSWGLCPSRELLFRAHTLYQAMRKAYDATAILAFWQQEATAGRHTYSFLPFGNFNKPITRKLLDDKHEPTGRTVTYTAPYGNLVVQSHLSVPFVLWNLMEKVATQEPSAVLCTPQQNMALGLVKKISQLWSSLKLPSTFYNPPLPLLQQPAFTPGTESDEEKTVYSLRTRKVTTQGDDIDEPVQESCQSTGASSTPNPAAGQKRKSRHAGSTASNADPTSSQPVPEPRPRKSRPGRSAPSRSGKD